MYRKRNVVYGLAIGICCFLLFSSTVFAASPAVPPFPIGIYFPPDPTQTTDARYAEIAAMNANFIVGGNELETHTTNDAALTKAAANGLKLLVHDWGLSGVSQMLKQPTTGGGWFVRRDTSVGQTFASPASGTGWYIGTVMLRTDGQKWQAGVKLRLCVYDSPSKSALVGCDVLTGPVNTAYPEFYINAMNIVANHTYYMELTTFNNWDVGLIQASTTNTYNDGQAYVNGAPQSGDLAFEIRFSQEVSAFGVGKRPTDTHIDFITDTYKTNPALLGYNVKDEPPFDVMPVVRDAMNRFRANDPNHMTLVNLLPSYASTAQLFGTAANVTGEVVTSAQSLGQTFTTGTSQTQVNTVKMYIDKRSFGAGEALKLTLWNSPAKTSKIAETTITSMTDDFPVFALGATVSPNTSYYMELTHNGGGDNQIGWVVRSQVGTHLAESGTAYVAGSPIDADFWYVINQNFTAFSYEDYVYRWMSKKPDVLSFDHYPFLANGSMRTDYFSNLEIIRRQSLLGQVDFWSYLQSIGMTGVYRAPSQDEMRYQIYTNLAYGAKGLMYFTYFTPPNYSWSSENFPDSGLILRDGSKNASYTWAKNLNGEVMKLGPTLTGLTSQAVYHTGTLPDGTVSLPPSFFWQPTGASQPAVIGSFTNGSGRKYVMVVNRDTTASRTLAFTLTPKPGAVTEVSKTTGNEVATNYNAATGAISDTFAPGEGKLYALPAGY